MDGCALLPITAIIQLADCLMRAIGVKAKKEDNSRSGWRRRKRKSRKMKRRRRRRKKGRKKKRMRMNGRERKDKRMKRSVMDMELDESRDVIEGAEE